MHIHILMANGFPPSWSGPRRNYYFLIKREQIYFLTPRGCKSSVFTFDQRNQHVVSHRASSDERHVSQTQRYDWTTVTLLKKTTMGELRPPSPRKPGQKIWVQGRIFANDSTILQLFEHLFQRFHREVPKPDIKRDLDQNRFSKSRFWKK